MHTQVMRQAFVQEAVLLMEPHADVQAPGAAVTVALCKALGARAAMPAGTALDQRRGKRRRRPARADSVRGRTGPRR
jgi:hypothetical protein